MQTDLSTLIVVTGAFNKRVEASIKSALRQSLNVAGEIIIVTSRNLQEQICRLDIPAARLRLFEKPDMSYITALDFAISQASGRYLSFVSLQGLWLPDKTSWQLSFMTERTRTDAVLGATHDFTGDASTPEIAVKSIEGEKHFKMHLGAALIRTQAFEKIGTLGESGSEADWCIRLRESTNGLSIHDRLAVLMRHIPPPDQHTITSQSFEALKRSIERRRAGEQANAVPVQASGTD